MTQGAVAAGSPLTVQAGLDALRAGGNAVDGAVAAALMACVAEPLLTGLGGAGVAIAKVDGRVGVCDLFTNVPGLERDSQAVPPDMQVVELDFGPTSQTFHVGHASVAVPGMAPGLHALHRRHGRLPFADLCAPAAQAARSGIPVTPGFERVLRLLWPIQQMSAAASALFGRGDGHLMAGDSFTNPQLGDTLDAFAKEGPSLFVDGPVGRAMLAELAGRSQMTAADLAAYQPEFQRAMTYRYRDARVAVPPPPSAAGLLVLQALRALEDHGPMPAPLSAPQVRFLVHALERVEATRTDAFHGGLFETAFVRGFLAAIAPQEIGEERAHSPGATKRGKSTGHTTHISVVDEDGNAVGITSSLGETAGHIVPGTGVAMNNFLGEADVNPMAAGRGPGERLMTMCCPTLVELGDRVFVMGSGGSSRIRSAVLHGLVYLTDHGMSPETAVAAPRAHVEGGLIHVEADGRPPGTMERLAAVYPTLRRFDGANMFFGGLNLAGVGPEGFEGAGDRRRSGTFATT